MGIETGLLALGASAGTAATVSTIATGLLTSLAGSVVSKALAPKQPSQGAQVAPLTQADKPQAEKAPDRSQIENKNAMAAAAAGQLAGNNSTLLTGSQGINPGTLNLGSSTLLGN